MKFVSDAVIAIFMVLFPALLALAGLYAFLFEEPLWGVLLGSVILGSVSLFGLCSLFPERIAQPLGCFAKSRIEICSKFLQPLWRKVQGPVKRTAHISLWLLAGFIFLVWLAYPLYVVTFQPLVLWLEHADWPERDLYWAISNIDCVKENWKQMKFVGFDYCRLSWVEWSDWVGFNSIINWFLKMHVLLAGAIISYLYYLIVKPE